MTTPKPTPPATRFTSAEKAEIAAKNALPLLLQEALTGATAATSEVERLKAFGYARDHGYEYVRLLCTRPECLRLTGRDAIVLRSFRQVIGHTRHAVHFLRDFKPDDGRADR